MTLPTIQLKLVIIIEFYNTDHVSEMQGIMLGSDGW